MLIAQASGAQIESLLLSIYNKSSRVNIKHPAAVGATLRVAHVMTELR